MTGTCKFGCWSSHNIVSLPANWPLGFCCWWKWLLGYVSCYPGDSDWLYVRVRLIYWYGCEWLGVLPHLRMYYLYVVNGYMESRDSLLSERRTLDRKASSSNPRRSGGRIFFCRINLLCSLLFDVRSTPVLPQWQVKDLSYSAKNVGGRLHLNTHTPLTQRSRSGLTTLSRHSVGTYQGNELTCNTSGNTQPQLSQLVEALWADSGVLCGLRVRALISTQL